MSDQTILEEAQGLVYGDRAAVYGHPRDNFARTAALLQGYFDAKGWTTEVKAEDVAIIQMMVKIARLIQSPDHRDSHTDLAGYAATLARVHGIDA